MLGADVRNAKKADAGKICSDILRKYMDEVIKILFTQIKLQLLLSCWKLTNIVNWGKFPMIFMKLKEMDSFPKDGMNNLKLFLIFTFS